MEGTLSTGRPLWRGKKSDMLIDTESDTTEMVAESQFVQSPCDIKKRLHSVKVCIQWGKLISSTLVYIVSVCARVSFSTVIRQIRLKASRVFSTWTNTHTETQT